MERCEVALLDLLHFSICAHLAMSQESSKHCPLHSFFLMFFPAWIFETFPLGQAAETSRLLNTNGQRQAMLLYVMVCPVWPCPC